jgi:hypothetical protein
LIDSKEVRKQADELVRTFGLDDINSGRLATAREIACAAIERYGDLDDYGWHIYRNHGIWNDHSAVQAALIAIKMFMPKED